MAALGPELAGVMASVGSALAAAALLTAAADDLDRRVMSGGAVAAVGLAALLFLAGLPLQAMLLHLILAAAGLGLGLWASARGLAAGADARLLGATLLWAGPDLLQLHLAGTALAATGIGLALLGRQALATRSGSAPPDEGTAPPTMPIGAAIACGGLLVVLARAGLLGAGT